jgi:hypothetical protein
MLFIDTQQYLDLYRMPDGKKLLKPLAAVKGKVFVTAQIVDEVARRKLEVARDWLVEKFGAAAECAPLNNGVKEMNKEIPDHLFGTAVTANLDAKLMDLRKAASVMHSRLQDYKTEVAKAVNDLLEQISRSEDEVSKALASLFQQPIEATTEELAAARLRRERGRAPGKKHDPLGDQISWEQILRRIKGYSPLWVISRDGDYCTKHGSRAFLNAVMHEELKRIDSSIEIRCFSEMERGLRDFINANGVPDAKLLTPDEAKRINEQQELLAWFAAAAESENPAYGIVQENYNLRRHFRAAINYFRNPVAFIDDEVLPSAPSSDEKLPPASDTR